MRRLLLLALLVCSWTCDRLEAKAQTGKDEAAIRAVITAQVEAWNRGDIPAFMEAYEHSPETTFIGANIGKGYEKILERYQKNYTTASRWARSPSTISRCGCCPAPAAKPEFAVVTGRFHLERSQKGEAKKDDGIFSLVWRKGPQGWKIVLDHTS